MRPKAALGGIRGTQAVLVAAALLLGFSSTDAAAEITTTGRDAVEITVEAPVVDPRGPWDIGDVLTHRGAGIDASVAPIWHVRVEHVAHGVALEPGAWKAETRIEKVSGDGRAWWTVVEAVPLESDGAVATFTLDMAAFAARAAALDAAGKAPGRLDAALTVTHEGAVVVNGARHPASRSSVLQLSPSGTVVSLGLVEAAAEWTTPAPASFPWTAVLLGLAAVVLEPMAQRAGRRVPVWERARGVHVVEASVPPVPADAPRCDLPTAIAAARRTGGVLVVDRARNVALLQGPVTLVADLEPGTVDLEIVPRPPERRPAPRPDRPMTPLSEVFGAPAIPDVEFEVAGEVPTAPWERLVQFHEVPQGGRRPR